MNRCICFSVVLGMSVATCSSEPALPILTVVEPDRMSNASEHEIIVKGEHFFVDIYADLNAANQSRLNTTFGLTLVRNDAVVDLIDVRWVSELELRAWVPAEVALGVFRLELVDPRGRRAALRDALLVYSDPQQSGAHRVLDEADCAGGSCSAQEECEDGCCVYDTDSDGDGHVAAACGGDDCDDESADTFPGAAPNDDPDACMKDADLDGYADSSPPGGVTAGTDCADSPGSDPACNGLDGSSCRPGLTDSDLCDGADNDCDGLLDEDPDILWYRDADGDGFTGTETVLSCTDPDGAFGTWLATATTEDCDDTPLACGVNCYPGNSAPDICDGYNQDCNGQLDEDPDIVWYHDADGDGFTNSADTSLSCVDPDGAAMAWVAAPTAVDCDDDPVACGGECYPGNAAQDVCDGANQDCDADVDEDPDILWYRDADGDGFTGTEAILSCLDPDGAGAEWLASPTAEDCDDDSAGCGSSCHPGALEICDGLDNDCTPASPDGDADPLLGIQCDGVDTDLCLEGTFDSCVAGSLNCSDLSADDLEGPIGDANCTDDVDNDCDGAGDEQDHDCGLLLTPPAPLLTVSPGLGDVATVFRADSTGTTDRTDGPAALSYNWDWENDGTYDAAGASGTHSYPAPGDYTLVLAVTDTSGLTAYTSMLVIVADAAAIVNVTTTDDEDDSDATPALPGGAGLSLREAIKFANSTAGRQHILLPSGWVFLPDNEPPVTEDSAGVDIMGYGATLDGAMFGGKCFVLGGLSDRLIGVEVRNCDKTPVSVTADSVQIAHCFIHDNGDKVRINGDGAVFGPGNKIVRSAKEGIEINAPTTLQQNIIADNKSDGVKLKKDADGSIASGNLVVGNRTGIVVENDSNAHVFWHNTFVSNLGSGIKFGNSDGHDVRNNILAINALWALDGTPSSFSVLDANDYSGNGFGPCAACLLGPNDSIDPPLFIDAAFADFRLTAGSPLVDAGIDLDIDVNGPGAGLFDGTAPDIGSSESPF